MSKHFVRMMVLVVLTMASLWTPARALSPTLVISQVYSGRPNGPVRPTVGRNDFIELFNRGSEAVNVDGWTVQYASQDESFWQAIGLTGTIGPGQYYLVTGAFNLGAQAPLPASQVSSGFRLDAVGGRIALVNNNTLLASTCPSVAVFDFLSYGSTVCLNNAPALNPANALLRAGGGCVDTDAVDFALVAPYPRNAASPRSLCGGSTVSPRSFTISSGGGLSLQTSGADANLSVGYIRIQPSGTNITPAGFAIFSQRQGQTLISEATVPAVPLIRSGLFYVDVNGPVNTGVAIANPNDSDVTVSFSFFDASRGILTYFGLLTVPANGQIARFMNELPWALVTPAQGTLAFTADRPVGVVALRGRTNERGDFLITTSPVVDGAAPLSTEASYLAHFAAGSGWRTEAILINPSTRPINGTMEFRNAAGEPVGLRVGTEFGTSFPYSLLEGASQKFTLNSAGGDLVTGSIRLAPANGTTAPVALAVFSYTRDNIVVSEAGLSGLRGTRFRTYVEYSGTPGSNGSILAGLAIASTTGQSTTVDLELTRLDGTATGLKASVSVPASGQVSRFLNELFPSLTGPFQGTLKATSSAAFAMIGLRARYNERGDFLITTVPPVDETQAATSAEWLFPHFADSGGYSTQFILFGASGQPSAGNLRSVSPGGQPLSLQFR
jgi:hypothetical protein